MAHTAGWPAKKNSEFMLQFPIYDADGDLVTGAADLDSEVSKDGGTFTDCTNEAGEIASSSGCYALTVTNTEMNADRVMVITKTSTAGAKTAVNMIYPSTANIDDVKTDTAAILDDTGTSGVVSVTGNVGGNVTGSVGSIAAGGITASSFAAGAIDAAAIANGAIDAATFAAGAIDASAIANAAIDAATFVAGAIDASAIAADAITSAKIATGAIGSDEFAQAAADKVWSSATRNLTALGFVLAAADIGTDAIGAAELATDAVQEIRDAILSDSTPFAGAAITEARLSELDQGTAGKMANEVDIIKASTISVTGAVSDAGPSATDFDTNLAEASDDHYNGHWLIFTGGNLAGQARMIRDYDGTANNVAFDRAFTEAPANTDAFTILAPPSSAWDTLLARLADVEGEAAVSNRMALWAIAKLVNKVDASSSPLTVYKTNDTSSLFTQTITENATANPIETLDTV